MANELSNLQAPAGSRRKPMRVGRGEGQGKGKTCGRGTKGQRARGTVPARFEGGQMPLHRRLPKRGFVNIHARRYSVVQLAAVAGRFSAGETVDAAALRERSLISGRVARDGVKVIGGAELSHALTLHVAAISGTAAETVRSAGGEVHITPRRNDYDRVRVSDVSRHFSDGDRVDTGALKAKGLVSGERRVWITGHGTISSAVTIAVGRISPNAAAKVRAAGGTIETA